jgi:hypothetical protein
MKLEIEMTNTQVSNSNGQPESGDIKDVVENKISATSDKDALGDKSLDDVSGGGWPYATMSSAQVTPTI